MLNEIVYCGLVASPSSYRGDELYNTAQKDTKVTKNVRPLSLMRELLRGGSQLSTWPKKICAVYTL